MSRLAYVRLEAGRYIKVIVSKPREFAVQTDLLTQDEAETDCKNGPVRLCLFSDVNDRDERFRGDVKPENVEFYSTTVAAMNISSLKEFLNVNDAETAKKYRSVWRSIQLRQAFRFVITKRATHNIALAAMRRI